MHVLHLEDDGPLREVLKAALLAVEPGIDLHQFVIADDAVSYIESNKDLIDLFILDIRVPGEIDGLGVAQKIRDFNITSPVVVTSAYRNPNRALLKSLNCDWFPKPWHILNTTQKILDIAKERRHQKAVTRPSQEQPAKTDQQPPLDKQVKTVTRPLQGQPAKTDQQPPQAKPPKTDQPTT